MIREGCRPIALGVLLCVAGTALAAGPASSVAAEKRGPRIRFEASAHDFGSIPSNRKVEFRWVFHNDGDEPLRILTTRPSCACTATLVQKDPVPPGGTGFIDVTFDPTSQYGQVHKSLAVTSNDPVNKAVLLTMEARVIPSDTERPSPGHPPISGQSLLIGDCASCHAKPASGKSGGDLWNAVCSMCHGRQAEGGRAPSLREASYLESRDDKTLADAIAYGTVNPKMPGFSVDMGGPLSREQIESLVKLLRSWGPIRSSAPAGGKDSEAPAGR